MPVAQSNAFRLEIRPATPTVLGMAADALRPGDWVDFPEGNNPVDDRLDIQWQTRWFYDPVRREGQYMGKPASGQSLNYSHFIYDEATNEWRTTGKMLFPGIGHAWGYSYDFDHGDLFFLRWTDDHVKWMRRATETWHETAADPGIVADNPSAGGCGWHPHLFGEGDPGVVIWTTRRAMAWRRADESIHLLDDTWTSGHPLFNRAAGTNVYVPALDTLVMFARNRNDPPGQVARIERGRDGMLTGMAAVGDPPIQVYGAGGDTNIGRPCLDPNDDSAILLFERFGSSRIWRSRDAGATWIDTGYTHPFGTMAATHWIVTNVDHLGVVWAITSSGSPETSRSRLFRPYD